MMEATNVNKTRGTKPQQIDMRSYEVGLYWPGTVSLHSSFIYSRRLIFSAFCYYDVFIWRRARLQIKPLV